MAQPTSRRYAAFFCACCCALTFAHRTRCAAAILFRAARLTRRAGFDFWAGIALGFIFPCAQRCFNSRDSYGLVLIQGGLRLHAAPQRTHDGTLFLRKLHLGL